MGQAQTAKIERYGHIVKDERRVETTSEQLALIAARPRQQDEEE